MSGHQSLIEQMNAGNRVQYNPKDFTLDGLRETISELFNKPHPPKETIIYTSRSGRQLFEVALIFIKYGLKYFVYTPSRVRDIVEYSLVKKHGLDKIRYDYSTGIYTGYHGTTKVAEAKELETIIELLVGDEYSLKLDPPLDKRILSVYRYSIRTLPHLDNRNIQVETGIGGVNMYIAASRKNGLPDRFIASTITVHTDQGSETLDKVKIIRNQQTNK